MKIKSPQNASKAPAPVEVSSAAPAEVAPAVENTPAPPAATQVSVRICTAPNVSFMLNPYTGQEFRPAPVEVALVDGWTQAQLDARKLVVC